MHRPPNIHRLVMWRQKTEHHDVLRIATERILSKLPEDKKLVLEYFNDPSLAIDALLSAKGLITELGSRRLFQRRYPAEDIIEQANIRRLPTAIFSGSPDAISFVVPENGGILIPTHEPNVIESMTAWISSLVVSGQ